MHSRSGGIIGPAFLALFAIIPSASARAANSISVGDVPTPCGGATMCSTNGTTGYLIDGTGQPFNISTDSEWVQIDTDGISHLAGQPVEPDGANGTFLVLNDVPGTINSFSLALYNEITSTTPSAVPCGGGSYCVNFQIDSPLGLFSTPFIVGPGCVSGCGTNSVYATTGLIDFVWSGGSGIAPGATFELNFASWDHTTFSGSLPEPGNWALMLLGLAAIGARTRTRTRTRTRGRYLASS